MRQGGNRMYWLLGTFGVILLCGVYLFAKARYYGWETMTHGSAGGYRVVSCKTMSLKKPWAFIFREADEGYHRIFDPTGRRVFEIFSDSMDWDLVITGDDGVEFQLDRGTFRWTAPPPP